jgi:transposase
MNQGMTRKSKLWGQAGERRLRELLLRPWARRREGLFRVGALLGEQIAPLDRAVAEMGDVSRFQPGKQVASYLGLIPLEYSSGGKQRLGSISKRGDWFMKILLVEAAQRAVRSDPQMRNEYLHRDRRKAKGVVNVAAARKFAIRLNWMLRTNTAHPEVVRGESSPRVPRVVRHGG